MAITPYRFKLRKLSSGDQRLLDAVLAFLPATGARGGAAQAIGDALNRHLGERPELRVESIQLERFGEAIARLPDPALVVVLGMAPLARRALCEIDAGLGLALVDRLLGGPGRSSEPREMSDTEQGVVQYLIMQVLAALHRLCGRDERVHFRFERFLAHPHEARELAGSTDAAAIVLVRMTVGDASGFIRLILPDPFAGQATLELEGEHERRPGERAFALAQVERFGFVRLPLWAEAGRTTLAARDLSALEEGDVILFDQPRVELFDGAVRGRTVLRIGAGLVGGIDADVTAEETVLRCTIAGIHEGE